jgi:hypothetical protein
MRSRICKREILTYPMAAAYRSSPGVSVARWVNCMAGDSHTGSSRILRLELATSTLTTASAFETRVEIR